MNLDELLRPSVERRLRRLPRLFGRAVVVAWRAARRQLLAASALQLVGGAGLAAELLVARRLLQVVLAGGQRVALGTVMPELLVLAAVGAIVGFTNLAAAEQQRLLSEMVAQYAASQVLEVAGAVDLVAFERPEFYDRLLRAQLNAQIRPQQVVNGLLGVLGGLFTTAGIAAALVLLQPLVLVLLVVGYVPTWLAAKRASRLLHDFMVAQTERDRRRMYLFRALSSRQEAAEVRSFGLARYLRGRHDQLYDERVAGLADVVRQRQRLGLAGQVVTASVTTAALALLVWTVTTGRTALASGGAAVGALVLLGSRLSGLASSASTLYEASLFLEDFTSFVDALPPTARVATGDPSPPELGLGRLAAEGVTFTYPSASAPALHDVSMEVRAGEVVALVGENGSGKTTLAKLLAGLFAPDHGAVTWDGIEIGPSDPEGARPPVAVIFQDFVRYHLSARENVGLGRHERLDDVAAIEAVSLEAGAHEFLAALRAGYETFLGPEYFGGSELSVGQWQRVAVARAMFRDAPLVILDEPAAALDARAEMALFDRIRSIFPGRAVVVISHRFANVRAADRIYVLRQGRIVEQGVHDDLVEAGGLYAELFRLQASRYVEDADPAAWPG